MTMMLVIMTVMMTMMVIINFSLKRLTRESGMGLSFHVVFIIEILEPKKNLSSNYAE